MFAVKPEMLVPVSRGDRNWERATQFEGPGYTRLLGMPKLELWLNRVTLFTVRRLVRQSLQWPCAPLGLTCNKTVRIRKALVDELVT